MDIIYFDNSATTKIKTEVLNEMMPYLTTEYGNASSLYSIGRKAKKAIEKLNECLDNGFYQVAEYKNGELMITVSDPPVWVTQMKNEITDL